MKNTNTQAKIAKHGRAFGRGVFRTFVLAGLSVIILYPLVYCISVAIRPASQLYDPLVVLVPRAFSMENINNALSYLDYWVSLPNSIVLVLVSTLLSVVACSLVGYGLARFKFKGSGILFALVVLTIIVPPQTVMMPNYMNFRYFDPLGIVSLTNMITGQNININLINTQFVFWLPALFASGIRSGVIIFIFRQFFTGMPRELEDAAYIDGCGPLKTFRRVMAPNAGGAYLTSFLFSIVWYWNDYVYTSSLMGNSKTVMNQLYRLKDNISNIMQYEIDKSPMEGILLLQAGTLLAILPPLILYIFLQKYFTESVERSGIVG